MTPCLRVLIERAARYAAVHQLPAPGRNPTMISATVEHAFDHSGSPEAQALLDADDAFALECEDRP